MGPASDEAAPPVALADVQKLLDERAPPGLQAYDPFWLSRFRINERKVRSIARAAPSWPAMPPISTAPPAGRA